MPPSTAWLSRGTPSAQRGTSPVRPSEEYIERLSPEPVTTPVQFSASGRVKRETNGQFLHGLGLSNTPLQDRTIAETDGLYLDSNGRAHLGAKLKSPRQDTRTSKAPTTRYHGPPKRPHPTHARTPSAMSIDDLANIAIATSPQFATSYSRPSTSYIQGYSYDMNDRAAKRIKSERLYSNEFLKSDERPKSSREEDAELLLGLSRGFSFANSQSTPIRPLPPPRPLSIPEERQQTSPSSRAPPTLKVPVEFSPTAVDNSMQGVFQTSDATRRDLPQSLQAESQSPASYPISSTAHIKSSPLRLPHVAVSIEEEEKVDLPSTEIGTIASNADHIVEEKTSEAVPSIAVLPCAEAVPVQTVKLGSIKEQRRVPVEASQPVCPICNQINSSAGIGEATTKWINCEGSCDRWFHINCAGFSDHEVKKIAKFVCKDCEPVHGQTKFARTSTRTRAAPDYAALNEGVTKSTEDADMHHFVSKFKDGTIKYHRDSFARIRPELLTKELWENFDGTKRPFVVPSIWNPRYGKIGEPAESAQPTAAQEQSTSEAPTSHVTFSSSGEILNESTSPIDATPAFTTVEEEVVDLDQDYLGMIMPRELTVRKVAALVGNVFAPVIDVMKQQGLKKNPTLSEWADYYDDKQKKEIRNVISLEISNSRLGRLIRRPEVVRQIDLQDQVWDLDNKNPPKQTTVRKHVAFYCLMSVGDSFTDFHIDFGGSSVYYHILKGRKTFFFIPPTEKYLKKYEEWNDTPNQNSIWLGDWCDGNVTRVDLFPGDTAFIPAGWIHSVWTPEDSLVIGGNFLTRYDFDMQLKVVNIEKTNGTPLMFRYPHFQRVMWYTLIKYLEDDPIPQFVIDDFLDDSEYAYVRSFPIWHLHGYTTDPDCEPEEDEIHCRTYTKSELRGLGPLRDYLYRTARIYADLPVKGKLDKSKNNAVKNSVPKAFGDPMQLIREFAIFVAWIRGNETAPDWLYSDDDPTLEQEGKETLKKAETFRIPGERVSTRRKARVSGSPGADSRASPDEDDRRESPAPKSLGPRIACAACRKKRPQQSCRHATRLDETAQQTLERTRTYSNVSIDIARLARASPVVNSIEGSTAPPKQTPQLAPPAATSVDEDTIELSTSSDVAQAAATRMTSPFDQNGIAINGTPSTPSQSRDQPKKGRSKACDECRKSKRRCVHDEHGRVDPAKAAEPSKPRGSTSAKRPPRLSDEHQSKRVKLEDDYAVYGPISDLDAMIDPALMGPADSTYGIYQTQPLIMTDVNAISTPPHTMTTQHSFASSGPVQPPAMDQSLDPALMDPALLEPLPSEHDFTGIMDRTPAQTSALPKLATAALTGVINSNTPDVDKSFSPITAEEVASKAESEEESSRPVLESTVDHSRNVSIDLPDQPHTNGVVRAASNTTSSSDRVEESAKQTRDLNIDHENLLRREATPHSTRSRRSSSRLSNVVLQNATAQNPPEKSSRRPSTPTKKPKMSPGFTIELKNTPQTDQFKRAVSDASSEPEEDASTRLAKELHAQEHGLRRRPSIRTS